MNKELLKADIESVLFDKYEVTADKAQPYQLHEALSSAIMKQIAPVRLILPHAELAISLPNF